MVPRTALGMNQKLINKLQMMKDDLEVQIYVNLFSDREGRNGPLEMVRDTLSELIERLESPGNDKEGGVPSLPPVGGP
jgi:hypothetical protein